MFTPSSVRRIARFCAARVTLPRRLVRSVTAALGAALLVAACAMPTHPDASAPPPDPFNPAATQLLDNTAWQLVGWKNADGTPRAVPGHDGGAPVTLDLSAQTGRRIASGFAGCNRYTGPYTLQDGKLGLGPLAATRMACATPGGQFEPAYLDALAHIERSGVQMRPPQQLLLILDDGATLTFAHAAR